MDQTWLHIVVCNFCVEQMIRFTCTLELRIEAASWKGFCFFSIALFFRGKHSATWHEDNLTWERREERERADETSSTDEIFTTEEVHSWTETLPLSPLSAFFFLTWHRGTCFPLCRPIYAISEGEVITQGWGGMYFILSSLPARLGNPATFWSA